MRSHSLEVTAKTVDEAVEQALRQLGVPRSEVEIVVLKEGRLGFLGFGAEDAVVRVALRGEEHAPPRRGPSVPAPPRVARPTVPAPPRPTVPAPAEAPPLTIDDTAETAQIILEDLIDRMHLHAAVRPAPGEQRGRASDDREGDRVTLDIRGEEMGLLIGRRGETLAALQLLVNMLLSRRLKRRAAVAVDVEGYRRRREEDLQRMAHRVAGQVRASGEAFTFEPMQPRERRVIHVALAEDPQVMTESTGEGEQRRVVVMLRPGASAGPREAPSRGPSGRPPRARS